MNEQRRVLVQALAAAGAVGLCGRFAGTAAAEPPPETTRLRLGTTSYLLPIEAAPPATA